MKNLLKYVKILLNTGNFNMKVLMIGNYLDGTGWANACIGNILALDAVGVDVVPRPIKLNQKLGQVPQRLLELQRKSERGCTIDIQHVLPHMMDYHGALHNIGLFESETTNFLTAGWKTKLGFMDDVWAVCNEQKRTCLDSGLGKVPYIVPHAVDTDKFCVGYEPLPIPELKDKFVFYFIGEMNRRKNLAGLLKAFHTEFGVNENVELVIKTSVPGVHQDVSAKQVNDFCQEIKRGLKLHSKPEDYKKEIVITQELRENELYRLHKSCNCFVMPSYGEAWCLPAMDALGFGNPVIANSFGGMADYVNKENGWLLDYQLEPVFGLTETFQDMFTGLENWGNPNLSQLRSYMREAYANKDTYTAKSDKAIETPYNYTYEKVGQIMLTRLEKINA